MPSPATISDWRLTFVWVETILDVLCGRLAPGSVPMPFAVSRFRYIDWFNSYRSSRDLARTPEPPWPIQANDGFWWWYLGTPAALADIGGALAWRSAVPVRLPTPLAPETDVADLRIWSEGLAYPWGVTFVVHLVSSGTWRDFGALAAELIELRREDRFLLHGAPVTLDDIGASGLDALRVSVFGPDCVGRRMPEPFSLFSPVRGSGSVATLDPYTVDEVHRLLHVGASFSATWDWDELIDLDASAVGGLKQKPRSHIVVGTSRGRSIWAPAHLVQAGPRHTLSCRHRNLVMASAQTDSLAAFAVSTVADGHDVILAVDHDFLMRRGVELLGGLYLGATSSFKSLSPKRQLDDSGALPAVNQLRARFGVAAL